MDKLLVFARVGSQVVLYALILLSVMSIGLIIERWWWFRRRRVDSPGLSRRLKEALRIGDRTGARKALEGSASVEAAVMVEALDAYDRGPDTVKEVLEGRLREQRSRFESGLVFLGTLGNNAPFIGLFGTVLGIVTAFRELEQGAAGGGNMSGVMTSIAEALIATAIGILVALPAVVAFNVFQKKCSDIEDNVGALGNVVLAELKAKEER